MKSPRYYHGGVRGFAVGDLLLPLSETGVKDGPRPELSPSFMTSQLVGLVEAVGEVKRRDRVYFAIRQIDAEVYASLCDGGGDLYEVEPIGQVDMDGDPAQPFGMMFCAPRARIVSVIRRRVPEASAAQMLSWFAEYEQRLGVPLLKLNRETRRALMKS
jgi:hypothetical protein